MLLIGRSTLHFPRSIPLQALLVLIATSFVSPHPGSADGVTFSDIAAGGGAGLIYERAPSDSLEVFDFFTTQPVLTIADWALTPEKPHGAPGVALLDYDGDGDFDIYVTNGPGAANSLFQNQLAETGQATFVDRAVAAGVAATGQDSSGTCFGDLDNDGDPELLVLSNFGPHRLFENQGDGTFVDISATAGIDGGDKSSVSCSFGDVDNDGLLDLAIGNNSVDMSNSLGIVVPFDFSQHNQLYRNLGGNHFADVSAAAGILETRGYSSPLFDGLPRITWAIALVDVDQDGDADLVQADDQAGVPLARDGGIDAGLIHVFLNDGSGFFTDVTGTLSPASPGAWMGLSFGDIDADGELDLFGTNTGDYTSTPITSLDPQWGTFATYFLGDTASRWYLGLGGGAFMDPGVGSLVATPFGWGTSMADYDNDADTDILFHGGLYFGPVGQGAPGAILENDGTGIFSRDAVALAGSTDHEERAVQGVAMGDLDGNGFDDIVTVSNFNIPAAEQTIYNHHWGSPFDGGRYSQIFVPTGALNGDGTFMGINIHRGNLSVELNGGENGNNSLSVRTLGSVGITSGGVVNRDGIGAVVRFTTRSGKQVLRPVVGGASYASQDSLEGTFGLGSERKGEIDVLWPGGVRNRLNNVQAGARVVFPEIPCSYDGPWPSFRAYRTCVRTALSELVAAGVIQPRDKGRFYASAVQAFREVR